jgi:hypothetical protein
MSYIHHTHAGRSSSQPPIEQQAMHTTMGLYLNASSQASGGGYQTKIVCPAAAVGGDDDSIKGTKKLTVIFCTVKCYCHGNHDVCYCCQLSSSGGGPVCYDHLSDCQANCPICNPKCPPTPGTSFA